MKLRGYGSCLLTGFLVLIIAGMAGSALASEKRRVYAVVIANNHSLDADVPSLRFADDDGAKYFELFRALGAEVSLLAVLDPDAQRRYPAAAKAAKLPSKREVLTEIARVFNRIEADRKNGVEAHFLFVYSGHGSVGPNREGYINLQDAKFGRSDLYSEILSRSPASFNHLILDACDSYYLVRKKGKKSDKSGDHGVAVKNFLRTEELRNYPNTGVILAASKESETHEWGRWEAGIFSHELRSALLGAADINNDGKVTYREAAACIEAANVTITVPKARLKVFASPPAVGIDTPLVDLRDFTPVATLRLGQEMANRYHVEDARGIRIADLHYTKEQPVTLALVGNSPFFLRTQTQEAMIPENGPVVTASDLKFEPKSTSHKGSVEKTFKKHLYEEPFGKGFYLGMVSANEFAEPMSARFPKDTRIRDRGKTDLNPLVVSGWTLLGAGIGTGIASAIVYAYANKAYQSYQDAEDPDQMDKHQDTAESRLTTSRILLASASALAVTGATLLIVDAVKKKKQKKKKRAKPRVQPVVGQIDKGIYLGLSGTF